MIKMLSCNPKWMWFDQVGTHIANFLYISKEVRYTFAVRFFCTFLRLCLFIMCAVCIFLVVCTVYVQYYDVYVCYLFLPAIILHPRVSICWQRKCIRFEWGSEIYLDSMASDACTMNKIEKKRIEPKQVSNREKSVSKNLRNGTRCMGYGSSSLEFVLQEFPVEVNLSIRYCFYGTYNQEMRCRFIQRREKLILTSIDKAAFYCLCSLFFYNALTLVISPFSPSHCRFCCSMFITNRSLLCAQRTVGSFSWHYESVSARSHTHREREWKVEDKPIYQLFFF